MGVMICYNVLMDISRKRNREANEITLQYQSRREGMLEEELTEDNLTQLLVFVSHLDQTPPGAAELQRRRQILGECERIEGETSAQFYARLRQWLDKDMSKMKSPLHAPRQIGEPSL